MIAMTVAGPPTDRTRLSSANRQLGQQECGCAANETFSTRTRLTTTTTTMLMMMMMMMMMM